MVAAAVSIVAVGVIHLVVDFVRWVRLSDDL